MLYHAMAIFCEDVRDEESKQVSIIGAFNDRIFVPEAPAALPRLTVYLRINIPHQDKYERVFVTLQVPSGERRPLGDIDPVEIVQHRGSAEQARIPYVGVVLRYQEAPFVVSELGLYSVICTTEAGEMVCGSASMARHGEQAVA